jgi:Predicted membrane protein
MNVFQEFATPVALRIGEGAALAAAIALGAYLAQSLSRSGAIAAMAVGTAAVAAGWSWGALLVIYFATAAALSRWRADSKGVRTAPVIEKGGARDAMQVLANGGAFVAFALLSRAGERTASLLAGVAALGALAASTADSWGTEVGTAAGGEPRSMLTLRRVPPGTSGGVSFAGWAATLVGAFFIAVVARALSLNPAVGVVTIAGVAGATADTVLGASLQQRRWCATCERETERSVHDCGANTAHAGGVRWLSNDAVNFAATLAGAFVAVVLTLF